MQFDQQQVLTYTSWIDIEAYDRETKRQLWEMFTPWTWRFLQSIYWYLLMPSLGYSLGSIVVGSFSWNGFLAASELGIFVYVVWNVWYQDNQREGAKRRLEKETWECQLNPETFEITTSLGWKSSIPWRNMKMSKENSDAWQIKFEQSEIIVYRKPLREAGLEEEFRSRIGKNS